MQRSGASVHGLSVPWYGRCSSCSYGHVLKMANSTFVLHCMMVLLLQTTQCTALSPPTTGVPLAAWLMAGCAASTFCQQCRFCSGV